ncbi:recombinase RecT [Pseudomonas sp.]|uniref:recombinase RecT n=1 Tax=Pseudomonas sp. TaxID=306 RepID=UPI002FC9C3C8
MSNALAVIAKNTGASVEDITDVLRGMIVSAKNQHGAQATNAELAIVTGVCATYGLNPLVKECAAFVSGGKLSVVVMVDGWYKMVNRCPEFDGVEFDDKFDDKGGLVSITCRMFIKGRERPVCVTEYMAECKDPKSSVWTKWPARMLRHKAYIQCARMAFGITEIIDDDEASRIASNSPREKDITPATKTIDWDAIKADMAECGDEASLNAVCVELRSRLEADGQWAQAKSTCILMKSEHQARIKSYAAQADAAQGEVLEGEFESAMGAVITVAADPVEMEFE